MPEVLTLTTPVTVPALSTYRVVSLYLLFNPPTGSSITIGLAGTNGESLTKTYADTGSAPVATTMLTALNKANLSTQSLQNRILSRLIADGVLVGSVTGTPD